MDKCIIASDSFKGSLSSIDICHIFEEEYKKIFPLGQLIKLPIADGGEGSVFCFSQFLKGKIENIVVKDAYFNDILASYLLTDDNVAVIEASSCVGLSLFKNNDVKNASTIGVGMQIKDAINKGAKKIILCLGGSCSNDAGCGIFYELGARFYDENNNSFIPTGITLNKIKKIDLSKLNELIKGIKFVSMCDVNNPFYGKNGASYAFAKQKGANDLLIKELDDNLKYFHSLILKDYNVDININGSGAAGGIGGGSYFFLKASLKKGIDTILKLINFKKLLIGCDFIFTGEGRIDFQSFNGKVISGILKNAKIMNIPVIALTGSVDKNIDFKNDLNTIFTINREIESLNEALLNAKDNYRLTIRNILKLIKIAEKKSI